MESRELRKRIELLEARVECLERQERPAPEMGWAPPPDAAPRRPAFVEPTTLRDQVPVDPLSTQPPVTDGPVRVPPPTWAEESTPAPLPEPLQSTPTQAESRGAAQPAPTSTARVHPPERTPVEWERFFGMAVLGRIGVAAVLLAAGYFAQLAYRELSNGLRVAAIYGLSAAFIGVGFYVRERVSKRYVAMLWGGGAAAAYLAGLVARIRYDLVSPAVAMALLVGACALGQWLAHRLRHQTFAVVALAGAFAAPLLVGAPGDNRTFLFIYLAALAGWAAHMQRRWGWKNPRPVSIAGVAIVGGMWLLAHGGVDESTYLHLAGYMLLFHLGTIRDLARGRLVGAPAESGFVATVAGFGAAMFLATIPFISGGMSGAQVLPRVHMPAFGLIFAVVCLMAATGIAHAGRFARNRIAFKSLAHVGGFFLVVVLAVLGQLRPDWFHGATRASGQLITVALLGVSAMLLLFHQRLVKAGEAAALVALAIITVYTFGQGRAGYALWMAGIGVSGCAAFMLSARSNAMRSGALWIGLLTLLGGTGHATAWSSGWVLLVFGSTALWTVFGQYLARRRGALRLADNGYAGLILLSVLWGVFAFIGKYAAIDVPIFDPMTISGLLLVAASFVGAIWIAKWAPDLPRVRSAGWASVGMLGLVLIGHRETVGAVAPLASAVRDALHISYLCAASVIFGFVALRRRSKGIHYFGLTLLGIAILKALTGVLDAPDGIWPTVSLLVPMGTAWLYAVRLTPNKKLALGVALMSGAFLSLAWVGYALEARFPVPYDLLNLRAGTGLALLGAGLGMGHVLRRRLGKTETSLSIIWWLPVLAYLVGLLELLGMVESLDGAWPRVLVSVYTTIFAAGFLALGFQFADTKLRYAALGLFGCVVVKIGLYDLHGTPLPLRILVSGVLGLVLLGAAFAYAKQGPGGGRRQAAGPRLD